MEILGKNQREQLEIKGTVTEIKNADMAEGIISEPEVISPVIEKQRE